MKTFHQFCKRADSYAMYDYKASGGRNYTPKPPKQPAVEPSTCWTEKPVTKMPKSMTASLPELPGRGENQPNYDGVNAKLDWNHTHAWNTVSGTGFGRPYWDYPRNPYAD